MATEKLDPYKKTNPCEVKQYKARVQRPKILDEVFHQTRQKRSVYYFTSGRKINTKRLEYIKARDKNNPFELPSVQNLLKRKAIEKEVRDEERKADREKKVYDKHTFRTRLMTDFNERMMIPEDDCKEWEGIVDIDKQFFTVVKGRPLREKRLDSKKYIQSIKEGFISKLKTGFLYDEIYLIERQQTIETKTIDDIKQKLQEYTNSFDEFLAKDNDNSMTLLRQASEEAGKTNQKREELDKALEKFVKLKCDMYSLEEFWVKGNECRNFLYEVSPQMWKKRYEEQQAKTSVTKVDEQINLTESLESLLEPFLKETAKDCPPLYFTEPWQLRYIFRDMELKNQHSMLLAEHLRKPNEIAEACLEIANRYFEKETKKIEENLAEIENYILIEEKKAATLKANTLKFVDTTFKKSLSGENPLSLYAHIQNAYEACITSDGSDLSILEMLRDLEIEYKQLLLQLDLLAIESVKEAKRLVKQETAFKFGRAKEARKKVNYLNMLIRRMINAIDLPVKSTTRPLVFRSEPPPYVPKLPPTPRELTSEERKHIHFFTDKLCDDVLNEFKNFFPLGF